MGLLKTKYTTLDKINQANHIYLMFIQHKAHLFVCFTMGYDYMIILLYEYMNILLLCVIFKFFSVSI